MLARSATRLALILATSFSTSCQSVKDLLNLDRPTFAPEMEQTKSLRSGLETHLAQVTTTLQGVETELDSLTRLELDPSVFDYRMVAQAALASFDVAGDGSVDVIEASANAAAPVEAAQAQLEAAMDAADDSVRAKAQELYSTIESIGGAVHRDLPASIQTLAKEAAAASAQVPVLQLKVNKTREVAKGDPRVDDTERDALRNDYDAVNAEIEALEALAQTVMGQTTDYSKRIGAAATTLTARLNSLPAAQ